jgi:hypothetical protein
MEEMTATKALVELKMLDKRIQQKIAESTFIAVVVGEGKTTINQVAVADVDKEIKATKQSIMALIERRNSIKTALVSANAKSRITIAGTKYSVAEAIERKNSIAYEELLLNTMKNQYAQAVLTVEQHNKQVETNLKPTIKELAKSEGSLTKETIETTVNTLHRLQGAKLLDPINIKQVIQKLQDDIDAFKSDVDTSLSVVNAQTIIKI